MVMPEGVSGLDLAEKLRSRKPAAQGDHFQRLQHGNQHARRARAAGYVYLPKPSPSATIAAAIRDCLEKK
jgi:DNA-binding NarL/FixJ family response regulator